MNFSIRAISTVVVAALFASVAVAAPIPEPVVAREPAAAADPQCYPRTSCI
ncbi:hypothetical protein FA15DRAFT_702466 [Coprinopsis marcescibilis]|uniref:Uncharacterized protein n=1 Tax=Coprinopsis marcescibilis TaxID=230819 RepID=A0A5C3L3Z8_COPMA|nr:hypothetical protein FA15DRAFT_702466 [Coprinopsis marcescibilis]